MNLRVFYLTRRGLSDGYDKCWEMLCEVRCRILSDRRVDLYSSACFLGNSQEFYGRMSRLWKFV